MNRRPAVLFEEDLPAALVAQFDASGSAEAWLIDVVNGRVVAATETGAARLNLQNASARFFDASMPALVRFREAAAQEFGDDVNGPEPLLFWTRHGAVRIDGRFRLLRDGTRTLAFVTASDQHSPGARAAEFSPTLRAQLAHELKTPLSAIAAASEIMKEEGFGPIGTARYLGYASDIFGSAQHMLGIIERMLAEGAGGEADVAVGALSFTEIDAADVLRTLVSQMMPLAERAELSLTIAVAPRLPHLIADVTAVRQIVFNLLTNAIKFTERGGSVKAIANYEVDGPLTLTITDSGRGMTQQEIERFGQSVPALPLKKRPGGGLGLGLTLVRGLADANGADLVIKSAPGQGTSASIVFRKERVVPV